MAATAVRWTALLESRTGQSGTHQVLLFILAGLTTGAILTFLLVLSTPPSQAAPLAAPLIFNVNSPADVSDANPGNGVCETALGNGVCTLRAAIEEANRHPSADTIVLQPNTTYLLTRADTQVPNPRALLIITESVTILGA